MMHQAFEERLLVLVAKKMFSLYHHCIAYDMFLLPQINSLKY